MILVMAVVRIVVVSVMVIVTVSAVVMVIVSVLVIVAVSVGQGTEADLLIIYCVRNGTCVECRAVYEAVD